jgi:hypothetical protein
MQRVDVVVNPPVGLGPSRVWTVTFNVVAPPEPLPFPRLAKPLADYTGIWWNPRESGWGLSIHQGTTSQLFVTWYVYDANGQPVWYTIQMGRWSDFRTWTGTVYRTIGPPLGATFDPAMVQLTALGMATLSFDQTPATVDTATFAYTVGGVTGTKTISRMRY